MSKRINCTLTDAQWTAIIRAVNIQQVELEAEMDYPGNDSQRQLGVLDRAFCKLRDGD